MKSGNAAILRHQEEGSGTSDSSWAREAWFATRASSSSTRTALLHNGRAGDRRRPGSQSVIVFRLRPKNTHLKAQPFKLGRRAGRRCYEGGPVKEQWTERPIRRSWSRAI